jgi:hypothetical protein
VFVTSYKTATTTGLLNRCHITITMFSASKHIRLSLPRYRLRSFHTSRFICQESNKSSHSAEHYFKDVDTSPPSDPTIHRVDAGSENAQRPHEPPSGKWSQAGVQTGEYQNVDKEVPYTVPGGEKRMKTGYGAVKDSGGMANITGGVDGAPDAKSASGRN